MLAGDTVRLNEEKCIVICSDDYEVILQRKEDILTVVRRDFKEVDC